MTELLPFIWAFIIALAVFVYVLLDGFDLGIGMLLNFRKDEQERDYMVHTVLPVWDGNETWLVLGGGGIMAVFPLAFAVIMPALYGPIMIMLFGLVIRGVSFEYRDVAGSHKRLWDFTLGLGSLMMTVAQGLALGTLVQGIPVVNRVYAGGWWDWVSPFCLLTAVALVVGYTLLGAGWLIMKTEGHVREFGYRIAKTNCIAMLVLIGLVSLWTPFKNSDYLDRWFQGPQIFFTWIVPALVLVTGYLLWRSIARENQAAPFFYAVGLFFLSYIGLGISIYPYMVPGSVTIVEAAAPANSQMFLLVGVAIFLPLVLGYTAYSYYTFRGKVTPDAGHHY